MGDEVDSKDSSWRNMFIPIIKTEQIDISTNSSSISESSEILKNENEIYNPFHSVHNSEQDCVNGLDPLFENEADPNKQKHKNLKSETPDERAARLAKMSAYASRRLANESPEQRATRLKRMSEYAAKRLAHESSDQRAKRLARMSAYAAMRLASESPEQRKMRLARMSAYAARRQSLKKLANVATVVAASFDNNFSGQIDFMQNNS